MAPLLDNQAHEQEALPPIAHAFDEKKHLKVKDHS